MKLYAGFDGGGSKTACCLTDETGKLLGIGYGGPSNYLFCGREAAAQSVHDALAGAFAAAGLSQQPLTGAFVGSAAILLGHGSSHEAFFRECIETDALECNSDIVPVWFGGAHGKEAVVAIAGTGSIAYGCTAEGFFRVGGWGPILGDEGSGYDLGRQALQQAARMADGRMECDPPFLQALLHFYRVDTPHDLIAATKGDNYREKVASCTKAVFALAEAGCITALGLVERMAEELSLLCRTAERKTGKTELPVVLAGGLARPILPYLRKQITSATTLQIPPVLACGGLALERAGLHETACKLLEEGKPC